MVSYCQIQGGGLFRRNKSFCSGPWVYAGRNQFQLFALSKIFFFLNFLRFSNRMSSSFSPATYPASSKEPYLLSWMLFKLRMRMIRQLMQRFARCYTLKRIMRLLYIISKENLTRRATILHFLWLSLPMTTKPCSSSTRTKTSSCITPDKSAPLSWQPFRRMSCFQSSLLRRLIFQLLSALMFLIQYFRKFLIKIRSKR